MAVGPTFEAEVVLLAPTLTTEARSYWAILILVVYEYLLTLDREVRLVWGAGNRFSGASLLFLLSRYTALLRVMAFVVLWVTSTCDFSMTLILSVLELLLIFISSVFFGLRVYAFTGHKMWPALLVFITLTTPVVTNAYLLSLGGAHSYTYAELRGPLQGCVVGYDPAISAALYSSLLIITRISVIIGDLLVLAVTWYCTFSTWQASRAAGLKTPLSALLLRDGTTYFVVIAALSVVQLVIELRSNFLGIEEIYADSIMPILICRLILNLRGVDHGDRKFVSDAWSQESLGVVFSDASLNDPSTASMPTSRGRVSTISHRIATFVDPIGGLVNSPVGEE